MNITVKLTVVIILIISFFIPNIAYGNSAPVYLEEYPSFSIAPRENVPIKVDREELTFKIDKDLSDIAMVTAQYTLTNTSKDDLTVPMVFPFVSDGYRGIGAEIQFNGTALDYDIYSAGHVDVRDYLKNPQEFKEQVSIDKIIENINRPFYKPRHFKDTANAALYKVIFNKPSERQSQISFQLDTDKTRVLTFNFSGFKINSEGECTVSTYINSNDLGKTAYLLVLGEDTLTNVSKTHEDTIEKTRVNIKEFIVEKLNDEELRWYGIEKRNIADVYSMFIKEVDRLFQEFQYAFSDNMVIENIFNRNNISALLYQVEVDAQSTNNLIVSYPMGATIDREKSNDFINTFAYILNPAKKFQEFGGIDIRIELNSRSPYIVESSIPFREIEAGVYTASLDALPNQDLVFSTYTQEEVSFWDKTTAQVLPKGYARVLVGFAALILLFIALVIILFNLWRKRKN